MLEKLYTIKLPLDDRRKKLYIQGNFIQREESFYHMYSFQIEETSLYLYEGNEAVRFA